MYVATRTLKLGKGRLVQAGDPVPEASEWTYPVLKANLQLEWIKWVEDGSPKKNPPTSAQSFFKKLLNKE